MLLATITTAGLVLGLIAAFAMAATLWMAEPVHGPKDSQLQLQAAVTKTASFSGTGIDLGSGFAPGGAGMPMTMDLRVSAVKVSATDETYTFKVEDSPDNSAWTARSEGRLFGTGTGAGGVGAHGIGCTIQQRYVRYTVTIAGTSPTITYEAYLNPFTNA
jgi:hypothetical protein